MNYMKKTAALMMTSLALVSAAQADDTKSSSIHKFAAERLQEKLGTIRGTIKPAAQNVFLTEFMIDQLKPIEVNLDDERASLDSDGVDRNTITNSIEQEEDVVTLAGHTDLDELTAATDKLIAAQD